MKKLMPYLILIAIILSQLQLYAQITITATDINTWYAVGKALKGISRFDTTTYLMNIGISSTFQAQSWTLPSVQFTDTLFVANVAPTSTPHFSKFSSATHATISTTKNPSFSFTFYTYVRISGDSLYFLGSAIHEVSSTRDTTIFDMSDEIIALPYSMGTVFPPERDSSYYGPGNYSINNSTTSFDAFGAITLPNGTFQCLRQKHKMINEMHFNSIVVVDTTVTFAWLTKEGHRAYVEPVKTSDTTDAILVRNINYNILVDTPTSVLARDLSKPKFFSLLQNYPNPFNPSTTISFILSENSYTRLAVYNVLGQEIAILVDGIKSVGENSVVFNAVNLPGGIYFYRLSSGNGTQTGKMNFIK